MKKLLSLWLLILANAALAQTNQPPDKAQTNQLPDKITIDGVTYENVRWGKVWPANVDITFKGGVGTIPLEKLPADLQQRLGYDPQKAAAYRATEQAAQKKRIQQEQQKAKTVAAASTADALEQERRKWTEGLAKGEQPEVRLINGKAYDFSPAFEWFKEDQYLVKTWAPFRGAASELESVGASFSKRDHKIEDRLAREQAHAKTSPQWRGYVVRGEVISVMREGLLVDAGAGRTFFVRHHPNQSKMVDGNKVDVLAMPVGTYSYTTVVGTAATVPAYDFGLSPAGLPNQQAVALPPLESK